MSILFYIARKERSKESSQDKRDRRQIRSSTKMITSGKHHGRWTELSRCMFYFTRGQILCPKSIPQGQAALRSMRELWALLDNPQLSEQMEPTSEIVLDDENEHEYASYFAARKLCVTTSSQVNFQILMCARTHKYFLSRNCVLMKRSGNTEKLGRLSRSNCWN